MEDPPLIILEDTFVTEPESARARVSRFAAFSDIISKELNMFDDSSNIDITWLRKDDYPADYKHCWYHSINVIDVPSIEADNSNGEHATEESKRRNDILLDDAIVCYEVKSSRKPKYRYTKEFLLELQSHQLSNVRPKYLDQFRSLEKVEKGSEKADLPEVKKVAKKQVAFRIAEQLGDRRDFKKVLSTDKNFNVPGIKNTSVANSVQDTHLLKPIDSTRELLKKSHDIVLSPQRRSFNSGCFVSNRKSESDAVVVSTSITKPTENRERVGDITRRIGSGRIMHRDRESRENSSLSSSSTNNAGDYNRRSAVTQGGEVPSAIFERKYDYSDRGENKLKDRFNRNFYTNDYRKRIENNHRGSVEEEPEWMKDGPSSLTDTIELRGFDDTKDNKKSKNSANPFSRLKKTSVFDKCSTNAKSKTGTYKYTRGPARVNSESDNSSVDTVTESAQFEVENPDSKQDGISGEKDTLVANDMSKVEDTATNQTNVEDDTSKSINFNLEEILKMDVLPDIVPSDSPTTETTKSRFSRWFKSDGITESNSSAVESKSPLNSVSPTDSSLNMLLLNGMTFVPKETITKSDTDVSNVKCDTPAIEKTDAASSSINLLKLFSGSQKEVASVLNTKPVTPITQLGTGKLHSVEEIEAKLRGTAVSESKSSNNLTDKKKKEEESVAFKQLLSKAMMLPANTMDTGNYPSSRNQVQVDNTNACPSYPILNGKPPQALPQMNQSNKQQELNQTPIQQLQLRQQNQLQQQNNMRQSPLQQETFTKLLTTANTVRNTDTSPSGINHSNLPAVLKIAPEIQCLVNVCQPTEAILARREVQHIMKGLSDGEITHYQLIEQLKRTTPQHGEFRESVLCILKMLQFQAINGPAQDSLVPSMYKAIYNNQSAPIKTASPIQQNRPQGIVNLYQKEQSSQPHPLPKSGLLQTIPVEQKHIAIKDLNLHKGNLSKTSSPSSMLNASQITPVSSVMTSTTSNATTTINSSTSTQRNSNDLLESDLSGVKVSTPIVNTPPSVLWSMSTRDSLEDNHNKQTPVSNNMTTQFNRQQPLLSFQSMMTQQIPPYTIDNKLWPAQKQIPVVSAAGIPIISPVSIGGVEYSAPIRFQISQYTINAPGQYICPMPQLPATCTISSPIPINPQETLLTYNSTQVLSPITGGITNMTPTIAVQPFQQFRNMNPHSQQLHFNAGYNVSPLQRKPNSGPYMGYRPNVNFAVQPMPSSVVRPGMPISGKEEQIGRYFPQELFGQTRPGQLPNVAPNGITPQNMLSVEELERMHHVRN